MYLYCRGYKSHSMLSGRCVCIVKAAIVGPCWQREDKLIRLMSAPIRHTIQGACVWCAENKCFRSRKIEQKIAWSQIVVGSTYQNLSRGLCLNIYVIHDRTWNMFKQIIELYIQPSLEWWNFTITGWIELALVWFPLFMGEVITFLSKLVQSYISIKSI